MKKQKSVVIALRWEGHVRVLKSGMQLVPTDCTRDNAQPMAYYSQDCFPLMLRLDSGSQVSHGCSLTSGRESSPACHDLRRVFCFLKGLRVDDAATTYYLRQRTVNLLSRVVGFC